MKLSKLISLIFAIGISYPLSAQVSAQNDTKPNMFRHYVNEEYIGFNMNYNFRPMTRETSIIDIDIKAGDNKFQTRIADQYHLHDMSNMKGMGFGIEYGYNNFFFEGQWDYMERSKTRNTGINLFIGYNFTFLERRAVAFRPAIGFCYNWLVTELGAYSNPYSNYYGPIEVKQANTLAGIKPRIQLELPLFKIDDDAVVFLRGNFGYEFYTYTSRYIKLRAEHTYYTANGNSRTISTNERFYLDGERSNYYINGEHINKTPTAIGGLFYGLELAIKLKK